MRACGFSSLRSGLDQREWREHVGAVDLFEHVERVVEQLRLRARTEDARVVDERVEAAGFACRLGELLAMFRVGNVAGDGDDARGPDSSARALSRSSRAAGVDDQGPAVLGQSAGEREAEAAGGARDERRAIHDSPVISYSSNSCLNTMYRCDRRRETSGGTVFGLYFGTARIRASARDGFWLVRRYRC